VITVPTIEPNPPAQPSNKGGRPARAGSGATVQPVEAAGRALATQRDALFFRSEAILRSGAPAQAPYLAQQIGQLWPSTPPATHKTALSAYQKNSPEAGDTGGRPASVFA
jgi:hypothetical protein